MKRVSITIIYLLILIPSFAQLHNYKIEKQTWYPGTIELVNGQKLNGEINYNFVSQTLGINLDDDVHTFAANNVVSFHFTNENRTFCSLPVSILGTNFSSNVYYEIIYSNSKLAILSRHAAESKEKGGTSPGTFNASGDYMPGSTTTPEYSEEKVFETLYIADKKGKISEYATAVKSVDKIYKSDGFMSFDPLSETNTFFQADLEYNILNKKIFKEIMGYRYDKVESFIKSRKLKIRTIPEIIEVIDYYDSLF